MSIKVNPSAPPASVDLISAYASAPTAIISDSMDRMPGAVGLLPYHLSGTLSGTAITVKTRSGDNLAVHKALDQARPGDVLVIDGGGDLSQALVGEMIKARAEAIGVAGFVIDGAIRDVAAFRTSHFPCYARGVIHRGPYKNGPGEVNVPVSVGGMIVMPGDIVVGDDDGVVAVPQAMAWELLAAVRKKQEHEREKLRRYRLQLEARLAEGRKKTG